MIRDFWVENYLSIRDRQTLSFVTKGPESELVAEVTEGVYLYKLAILFGANASGKSNMLLALHNVFQLMISPKADSKKKIASAFPFILTKDAPIRMHVSFYAKAVRYDYDVDFCEKFVLREALYYYPNSSKALFYERSFVGEGLQPEIKFGASLRLREMTQERIRENTLNNHSVLSVCNKNSFKGDIKPFVSLSRWVEKYYHDIDGDGTKGVVQELKEAFDDERKRKFYCLMLQKADLNIRDYRMVTEDRAVSKDVKEAVQKMNLPEQVQHELLRPTEDSVAFLNDSDDGVFDVPLKLQSKGTLVFVQLLWALYDLISGSHVYFLDELGENLHYDLLVYFLSVFLYNSDRSQLIITSQEVALLQQEMFNDNRGVVWMVEKNRSRASSEYSRGDSFGLHKNLSLYNSYRIGRLGAKPEVGSMFIGLD